MAQSFSLASSSSTPGFLAKKPFNVNVSGTWAGSWALERSKLGAATWHNCVQPDGTPSSFSNNGSWAVRNVWGNEPEGYEYRVTFTRTSGTLVVEFD